ncbi:MAG TPA: hypothetical protein VGE21_15650 [Flavobacteriales bacterium]
MKKISSIELLSMVCGLAFLTAPDAHGQQWLTAGNTLAADGILGTNTGSNFGILFRTNGTERMRLDNTGKLLMGMTSIPATPLTTALQYIRQSTIGQDWVQFRYNTGNQYWSFNRPNTTNDQFVLNYTTGSTVVPMFAFNTTGNMSLGAITPSFQNGKINIKQGMGDWFQLQRTLDFGYWHVSNPSEQDCLWFFYTDNAGASQPGIHLINDGRVSIGISDRTKWRAGYRLYVDDGILTEKVKVAIQTTVNWADHVFAPDYALMPLNEVQEFISCNGHLPGVPSAEEMVKEGLDVAKTDAMLMAKIEELTLYMLQLKAELEQLKTASSK